uniref:Uncharacterized protein n=1 Tax=Setaria italica TaxID=4555 RepID=K3XPY8_SETIT
MDDCNMERGAKLGSKHSVWLVVQDLSAWRSCWPCCGCH